MQKTPHAQTHFYHTNALSITQPHFLPHKRIFYRISPSTSTTDLQTRSLRADWQELPDPWGIRAAVAWRKEDDLVAIAVVLQIICIPRVFVVDDLLHTQNLRHSEHGALALMLVAVLQWLPQTTLVVVRCVLLHVHDKPLLLRLESEVLVPAPRVLR